MKELNNEEMLNVKGGAFSLKVAAAIGGAVIFFIGIIDGIVHPKKC